MGKKKGGGMTLSQMAGYFHMNVDVMISGLIAVQILNQTGLPKKKYIDDGYFYEDGTIADYSGVKELIQQKLGMA